MKDTTVTGNTNTSFTFKHELNTRDALDLTDLVTFKEHRKELKAKQDSLGELLVDLLNATENKVLAPKELQVAIDSVRDERDACTEALEELYGYSMSRSLEVVEVEPKMEEAKPTQSTLAQAYQEMIEASEGKLQTLDSIRLLKQSELESTLSITDSLRLELTGYKEAKVKTKQELAKYKAWLEIELVKEGACAGNGTTSKLLALLAQA